MKIEDYKIVSLGTGKYIATATVNGHKDIVVDTPACDAEYCQRDIDFIERWGKKNPNQYIMHMKTKPWAKEEVKALEDDDGEEAVEK